VVPPATSSAVSRLAERDERVGDALAKLDTGVTKIVTSVEFKAYLRSVAQFYNYSPFNQMLIWSQMHEATRVMGSKQWRDRFNRYINKGARGLVILYPQFSNIEQEVERNGQTFKEDRSVLTSFGRGFVFDISQTNGPDLPEGPVWTQVTTSTSVGEEAHRLAWLLAGNEGISIETGPSIRGERGSFSHGSIRIAHNQSVDAETMVMIHELGHHFVRKNKLPVMLKDDEEVVVDGAAFIVCEVMGIDTLDTDLVYLASWTRKDDAGVPDLDNTRELMQQCSKLARFVLKRFEELS
jgi:hypothetical protein